MLEARYVGSRGHKLLESRAFNQGYDLNDPDDAGLHLRAVQPGVRRRRRAQWSAQRRRDGTCAWCRTGVRLRERQLGGIVDYNLGNAAGERHSVRSARARSSASTFPRPSCSTTRGGRVYNSLQLEPAEADVERAPVQSVVHLLALEGHELGRSRAAPRAAASRTSRTSGFAVQGDQREHRRELRPVGLRPAASLQRELRLGAAAAGGLLKDVRFSGFVQLQSGCRTRSSRRNRSWPDGGPVPRACVADPAACIAAAFGRPSLCGIARRAAAGQGRSHWERRSTRRSSARRRRWPAAIRTTSASAISGRNVLRGFVAAACRIGLSKDVPVGPHECRDSMGHLQSVQHGQLRLARTTSSATRGTDFGMITDTIGGPRVMQLGVKVRF